MSTNQITKTIGARVRVTDGHYAGRTGYIVGGDAARWYVDLPGARGTRFYDGQIVAIPHAEV